MIRSRGTGRASAPPKAREDRERPRGPAAAVPAPAPQFSPAGTVCPADVMTRGPGAARCGTCDRASLGGDGRHPTGTSTRWASHSPGTSSPAVLCSILEVSCRRRREVWAVSDLADARPATQAPAPVASAPPPHPGMVWVPGGTFLMGSDQHYPEEAPAHQVSVDGFWIDRVHRDQPRLRAVRQGDATTSRSPSGRRTRPTIRAHAPRCCSPRPRSSSSRSTGSTWATPTLVDVRTGSELAAPAGAVQLRQAQAGSPRRPRRLGGRRGLRQLGRQGAAHRGRVGVRRPRWPGRRHLRLGRGAHPRRPMDGEHLAGRVPDRRTHEPTATRARRPVGRSRPTATACST